MNRCPDSPKHPPREAVEAILLCIGAIAFSFGAMILVRARMVGGLALLPASFLVAGVVAGHFFPSRRTLWTLSSLVALPVFYIRDYFAFEAKNPSRTEGSWFMGILMYLPLWAFLAAVAYGGATLGRSMRLRADLPPFPQPVRKAVGNIARAPRPSLVTLFIVGIVGALTLVLVDAYVRHMWNQVYIHMPFPGHESALHEGLIRLGGQRIQRAQRSR